ncbi:hypothetical protein NQ315_001253 [Exocentrus adspersus]|uniref:Peptidase C45 hydrolase domain-containing protein n=1 Tax=Exocentrus adspersus TaxID=1586481 RepID=A0AAV8WF46_9CUCU|nr:hypothetical protein NQ315_001253 [Exocentrus adspersus]
MPATESIGRRQCIPILYTRGSHYEVGFDVGRTFSGIINSFVDSCTVLNEDYLPAYETPEGRKAYEDTLNCLKANYPQYVQELKGTADGANVPFYKLFLLHMDNIILTATRRDDDIKQLPHGCSSICVNQPGQEILGHTEDALSDTLNHFYLVSAHIISDKPQGRWSVKEEKFTSLCYAGHLPGYTMGYNHHGLVFTINTLSAKNLKSGKTPRHFLTRALLSAENFYQVEQILRDRGCGAGDGCSINMTFLDQEGDRLFYNAEMAPADKTNESQLCILTTSPGENMLHCNSYLRLKVEEANREMVNSSVARMETFCKYPAPRTKQDVLGMLGDDSNEKYSVFADKPEDRVVTLAVGIFDLIERTWTLYSDNPRKNEPLTVLPLQVKSK